MKPCPHRISRRRALLLAVMGLGAGFRQDVGRCSVRLGHRVADAQSRLTRIAPDKFLEAPDGGAICLFAGR